MLPTIFKLQSYFVNANVIAITAVKMELLIIIVKQHSQIPSSFSSMQRYYEDVDVARIRRLRRLSELWIFLFF